MLKFMGLGPNQGFVFQMAAMGLMGLCGRLSEDSHACWHCHIAPVGAGARETSLCPDRTADYS